MNDIVNSILIIIVVVEALQIRQLQQENLLIKRTIIGLYEY